MEKQLLFALDIGTRSVVGLIGCMGKDGLEITATERQEHNTRSMLDGQIHDVPEVAQVISRIKERLEETSGPLRQVAVAAAGRSLCTIRAQADIDVSCRGALSAHEERTLELSALQAAQRQLAASDALPDPAGYYCVGYSVTGYTLDGAGMISLVGQRGKSAGIELIATFLPRQVIDSIQSALTSAGLELATITLEPIAAINVLIPATMRHLNLALVDVGAGTSDVAITSGGSVVAYGMVPSAGDEITEAISQHYLLDFNVAEAVKRQLLRQKRVSFTDVLGMQHKVSSSEVLDRIQSSVTELASDISKQILLLNNCAPQAVLLVGGGSLTPLLPQAIAQALDLPTARVAIRRPDAVSGFSRIPAALSEPDAVTPLGILKIAANDTLHFITVRVNDNPVRLFNLSHLTVADALLAAGVDARSLHGRPGMGITVKINGETRFLAGEPGEAGQITVNGEPAKLSDPLLDNASIVVQKGRNGHPPTASVADVIILPQPVSVTINSTPHNAPPVIYINNQPAADDAVLNDRDEVSCHLPDTVAQVLASCGVEASVCKFRYVINDSERDFLAMPSIIVDDKPAALDTAIKSGANIQLLESCPPTLGEVLGINPASRQSLTVYFNGSPCTLPARRLSISCNGAAASLADIAVPGSTIVFTLAQSPPTVSDVLLAAEFDPLSLPAGSQVIVLLNNCPAEYIAPVKNGDRVEVRIEQRK